MSTLTCSACKFYEPREANELHGEGYGICRHRSRSYRDYLGDGTSLKVAPIAHQSDQNCVYFEDLNPEPQQLLLQPDDNLVRAMLYNSRKTHEPIPSYYGEVQP